MRWSKLTTMPIIKTCKQCNKSFRVQPAKENRIHCSRSCRTITENTLIINCRHCNTAIKVPQNQKNRKRWCSKKCLAQGRYWENKSPEEQLNKLRDIFDREVIKQDDCWLWNGRINNQGYGIVWFGGQEGRHIGAHRASWLLHRGEIPKNMFICHTCDNPICTNPDHLFIGDPLINSRDRANKGRNRDQLGAKNNMAKLNENKVIEIRKLLNIHISITSIAKLYNVNWHTIKDIKSGKNWSHIKLEE